MEINNNEYLKKKGITRVEDLPEEEKVYVKKDIFGEWRIIKPIKNEDGSTNWLALLIGSWGNLFKLLIILAAIFLVIFAYSHDVNEIKKLSNGCLDNPVEYCKGYILPFDNSFNKTIPDYKLVIEGDEYGN